MHTEGNYFNGNMKLSSIVEADYHLLAVLSRLGIEGGFGEKTADEVCRENALDTETFILLCNVYSFPDYRPGREQLRKGHVNDVLRYLHQSHDYYISNALVSLTANLEKLIAQCGEPLQKIIWKFFSGYKSELEKHFQFEEEEVIPYVQNLLIGRKTPGVSIDYFEEKHCNVEEKLSDLRNLVMKSLPRQCDGKLRTSLLSFIFSLENDLERHTCIEDEVMVPMARLMEDPHRDKGTGDCAPVRKKGDTEELSDREKEILVSVAKGLINKEIADKHRISINTVITHRKNITRKTGIKTVAGLTVYAILNNLIDIQSL